MQPKLQPSMLPQKLIIGFLTCDNGLANIPGEQERGARVPRPSNERVELKGLAS